MSFFDLFLGLNFFSGVVCLGIFDYGLRKEKTGEKIGFWAGLGCIGLGAFVLGGLIAAMLDDDEEKEDPSPLQSLKEKNK